MRELTGDQFTQMIETATVHLAANKDKVDALNVFPVPDGDTGTNMYLTLSSGAEEIKKSKEGKVNKLASHFSRGLLMGARGNSGVILSQLFRGFAQAVHSKQTLNSLEFAFALSEGVATAYKAVIKPVEGTILTVANDAANIALKKAKQTDDVIEVMRVVLHEANHSLARTPDLLPVLKEARVVDSGGQGLVIIYEAFLSVLEGKATAITHHEPSMEELVRTEHEKHAQEYMDTDEIEYGYCTELMIKMNGVSEFNEEAFREKLATLGDSLLVVSDNELIKVHIHCEYPGDVLTYAQNYGSLINIKIENMREQHSEIIQRVREPAQIKQATPEAQYGVVTVVAGEGLAALFKSLGADEMIYGGQTMNPSTEDILQAVDKVRASTIFVLPNNANVVLSAQQAATVSDSHVIVIPTKTIPEGMAALFAFNPDLDIEENEEAMNRARAHVKSGQITYAVRDSIVNGIQITKGDFLCICNGEIQGTAPTYQEAAEQLIVEMIDHESELITLIYGEDVNEREAEQLLQWINDKFPEIDVEIQAGLQPVYAYIISVE